MASSTIIPSKTLIPDSPVFSRSNPIPRSNSFVSIPNSRIKYPSISHKISASITASDFPTFSPWFTDSVEKEGVFFENLDEWMRESVVEIVKSLKKAPLMVHVYCNESMEVKAEKGLEQNWGNLKKEWRENNRSPDGIILVQQLQDKCIDLEFEDDEEENKIKPNVPGMSCSELSGSGKGKMYAESGDDEETKAWGVLIQGKGKERECSRTACYLLKTCRVNSGLGFCGTHFSLIKVKNFRESAFQQIKNSWLL